MEGLNIEVGRLCTQCDDNNRAVNVCLECGEDMCEECTIAHKRMRRTKAHTLKTIVSQEENDLNPVDSKCRGEILVHEAAIHSGTSYDKGLLAECASSHVNNNKWLENEVKEKRTVLASMVNEIKQHNFKTLDENLNKTVKTVRERGTNLKARVTEQFNLYNDIIKERCNNLQSKVNGETEAAMSRLEVNRRLIQNGENMLDRASSLLNEGNPTAFLKCYENMVEELRKIQSILVNPTEVGVLRYNQACTTEDFSNIVQALGSIQLVGQGPSRVVPDVVSTSQPHPESSLSVPSSSEQLMNVLKSLTSMLEGDRSELLYRKSTQDTHDTTPSVNNQTFNIRDMDTTTAEITNPVTLVEKNVPLEMQNILRSETVKTVAAVRFETWGVRGNWKVEDGSVVMYSRTQDECEQCMQILKEAVLHRSIDLYKGSEFIVESDKWHMITGHINAKYPDQVQIGINHNESKVDIYATCTTVLNDTCDAFRIFLRDNRVKSIVLQYDESVVTRVMKRQGQIDKIKTSLSQFCPQITQVDKTSICVKGIGFGVGQAVRQMHDIAVKHNTSAGVEVEGEEERFDSDQESGDDDDERFSDDDNDDKDIDVKMNLTDTGGETDAEVKALCFPGDDRMLLVVTGDITELPVECLVNPADKTLKHDGGLAKAVVRKGGRSIQEECTSHVQRYGNVPEGQVFCSGPGKLPYSVIIHAVGPKWQDGQHEEREKLTECVTNCLKNASKRGVASIAFPAVSAGSFKFPLRAATSTIATAVRDFLQQHPVCSIREVYLCDKSQDTVREFVTSLKTAFAVNSDIIVSGGAQNTEVQAASTEKEVKNFDVRPFLMF